MDFDEYQKAALRTASPLTTERERLLCGQAGLCGESGEVADIIKKFAFHGHPIDRDKIAKELGDVMWYISLLSDAIGMTMGEVAALNIEKLKARYPDGFSTERSMNREGEKTSRATAEAEIAIAARHLPRFSDAFWALFQNVSFPRSEERLSRSELRELGGIFNRALEKYDFCQTQAMDPGEAFRAVMLDSIDDLVRLGDLAKSRRP